MHGAICNSGDAASYKSSHMKMVPYVKYNQESKQQCVPCYTSGSSGRWWTNGRAAKSQLATIQWRQSQYNLPPHIHWNLTLTAIHATSHRTTTQTVRRNRVVLKVLMCTAKLTRFHRLYQLICSFSTFNDIKEYIWATPNNIWEISSK